MKKRPYLLIIIALIVCITSCSTSDPVQDGVEWNREIRIDEPFSIRFASPFVEKSSSEISGIAKGSIRISPSIDFDVEVADAQTLCIYPKKPLDFNTEYNLSVRTSGFCKEGKKYAIPVKTLPPVVSFDFGSLTVDLKKAGVFALELNITSSDRLDAKYLESGVSITGYSSKPVWRHSDDGLEHQVEFTSIKAVKEAGDVRVAWNLPQYGISGERSFKVPSIDGFIVLDARNILEPYSYEISFSALVDKNQDFSELVSMPGAGTLNFSVDRNILTIRPSIKVQDSQFLSISKGIKSAGCAKLEEEYERYFVIPSVEPSIQFISKGSILPSASMEIGFRSIYYGKAEVRVKRIYESNVLQFFQNNNLEDRYCYTGNVARTIIDTTIVLGEPNSPKLRTLTDYGLNISELVKPERGAIYRVEIKGVDPLADFLEERLEYDYYFGAYNDFEGRVRNVLVSNLNIIAKVSDGGECTVFVTDILSASPVSGAKVKVYNAVNQLIAEGLTDGDGAFTGKKVEDTPATVVVSSGQDKSYLTLRNPISLSNFDVSGTSSRHGQRGFIFGERGVWRPGDEIHLTFVSMLDEGVLPAEHPVTAVLRNPQGQAIQTLVSKEGHDGMYGFTFKTDENAPTGNWQADVTVGGETFCKTVKIETVKPNNIIIDLSLNGNPAVPASSVRGDISAKWLVGAPAKALKARVDVTLSRARTTFDKYKDYTFEDSSRIFAKEDRQVCEVTTDAAGKAHFKASIGRSSHAPGFLSGVFTTRVFEKSGDFSIDRFTATVSPYDTYIGLKAPEVKNGWGEPYLDINRTHTFSVVALDASGKPVTKNFTAEAQIYQMGWNWWWSASSDGLASYAADSYNTPYKTIRFGVENGSGSFKVDFSDQRSGMFFIRVTDTAGGHAAAKVVTVSRRDEYCNELGSESVARLQILADKTTAAPGETVNITIPSSPGARALVTLEKGKKVVRSFWTGCKGDNTTIPVRIEGDMAPNIYVSVMLIQSYNNSLNDAPIRLFGVQRIKVEDPASHLNPVMDIAREVRPDSEVSFTVREKNGKPMSYVVALVDEGLLSLTRFKTPDPWNSFYATEALGINTSDLFDHIIGAYGAKLEKMFAIGGDTEVLVTPNSRAERFKPVSLYLGPFTVRAHGTGKHTVHIPQYIGNLRAMVVATDGRAMGASDRNVSVAKPLMVKATLPRIIGTDEEIVMPVTVFATKDNIGKVTVSYSVEGPLAASGAVSESVNMAKAGETVVNFRLKSTANEGVAHIHVTAGNGSDTSKETIEIAVRNPNPMATTSVSKLVDAGKTVSLELAPAGRPGTNAYTIEASSIPPISLENRLNYLLTYPHGCIEQTVSAAFPQLYLPDLQDLDSKSKVQCENNVKSAIAKLPSFAISTGGMTYWPGTSSTEGANVWGTIYATHFLAEVQAHGYAVPTTLYRNNIKYLRTVAAGKSYDALSRAYACYVLSISGSASRGDMNRLREDIVHLPSSAMWYLAAAYASDGRKEVASEIIACIPKDNQFWNRFSCTFDSEERDMAVASFAYKAIGNRTEAFKCIRTLSGWLNDRKHYMSTQSTAWALNAVSNYVKGSPADKTDLALTTPSGKMQLKGSSAIFGAGLKDGGSQKMAVEVSNNSKGPVYITLSSRGIPEKGMEVEQANGVRITVTFTLPDGTAVNPAELEQGTDFYVNMFVNNLSATRDYTNIALSQILPAGWEFDRTRSGAHYQDFRDDRVNTYFDLPRNASVSVKVKATAAYAGRYYMPATVCEAMYDGSVNASTMGQWCTVK